MDNSVTNLLQQEISQLTNEYNKVNTLINNDNAQKTRWLQQIENNNKRNRELRSWIYNIDKNNKSRIEKRKQLEEKKNLKHDTLTILLREPAIYPKKLEHNGSVIYYYTNNKGDKSKCKLKLSILVLNFFIATLFRYKPEFKC